MSGGRADDLSRSLARSYRFLAPFYDPFVAAATAGSRRRSIASLELRPGARVLLAGVGTGLDLPALPSGVLAVGADLTPAMLVRARGRARPGTGLALADAQRLPVRTASFDAAVLHLILAIVPDASLALAEATRAVKPGGRLAIFDKFLARGQQPGAARTLLDRVLRPLATGLNTRFEDLLPAAPALRVVSDRPDLGGGLFRRILAERRPE